MPTTINQLPTVTSSEVQGGDQLPVYSSNNGDTRKLSLSALLAYFKTTFTNPNFVTTINVPIDGFNVAYSDSSDYQWLLLRPAGTLASGTIVLPASSSLVDGQELIITTTQEITSVSYSLNGATAINGDPSGFSAGQHVNYKYNLQTNEWYRVG